MSKIPPKFERFFEGESKHHPVELRELLASKHPEYWGLTILNKIGHRKQPNLKTLREKCLDCCNNHRAAVRYCTAIDCPSWTKRMGTDPFRKGRKLKDA